MCIKRQAEAIDLIRDAQVDAEAKLNELDDMRRKNMVSFQQYGAIKAKVHQWFYDRVRDFI